MRTFKTRKIFECDSEQIEIVYWFRPITQDVQTESAMLDCDYKMSSEDLNYEANHSVMPEGRL